MSAELYCEHQYIRGVNKGKFCANEKMEGELYCSHHKDKKHLVLKKCISNKRDGTPCEEYTYSRNERCMKHKISKNNRVRPTIDVDINSSVADVLNKAESQDYLVQLPSALYDLTI